MPADYDSAISLEVDVPIKAPTDPGHGLHLRSSRNVWGGTNVGRTLDGRAMFLAYLQGLPGSDWHTNTAGVNARKRLSDFTTTGTVSEFQWNSGLAGDWFLRMESGATITTDGANWTQGAGGLLRKNPWWFLALWTYGLHASTGWIATIDWGGETGGVPEWRLRIAGDGTGALSHAGVEVARGPLTKTGYAGHRLLTICAKPVCRRCLYVYGDHQELRYEDLDLAADADACDPLSLAPFVPSGAWKLTAHARLDVQLSECVFAEEGTAAVNTTLPKAINAAPSFTRPDGTPFLWSDETAGTSVTLDTPGYVAGVSTDLTIEATLATANRSVTPIFYTTGFRFEPAADDRPDDTGDVLSALLAGGRLDVDEERATFSFTLKNAEDARLLHNRTVLLKCGDVEVFRGFTGGNSWDTESDRALTAECQFTTEDEWKRLEKILVPSFWDFSGMLATDAVEALLTYAGYTAAGWDIEASDFRLPAQDANYIEQGPQGEALDDAPAFAPDGGQSVADILRHINSEYTNRRMGFIPVAGAVKFAWKEPSTLAAASAGTFHLTRASAVAAGADDRSAVQLVRSSTIEPEANEIHVIGEEPGGRPIHVQWPDAGAPNPAQDPTLVEAARPANWTGERWLLEVYNPNANTESLARRVLQAYVDRCGYGIHEIEFDAEWNPAVTVWQSVTLDGDARYDGDWTITGFSVSFEREEQVSGERLRPCTYRAMRYIT